MVLRLLLDRFCVSSAVFFAIRVGYFKCFSLVFLAPTDYQGNMSQRTDHHMLEEENDQMVDHLSSKVQALKSVWCYSLCDSVK